MKNLLFILLSFIAFTAFSQQKAITDTGQEVLLYEDGTWKYLDDEMVIPEAEIPVNPMAFSKLDKASFLVKSTKTNLGVWLEPKKWSFKKSDNNDAAEFEFNLKGGDLYGMLITEKMVIPITTLKSAALSNARDAAPDIKIIFEEYRKVNGLDVLYMQMEGSMEGMKFNYLGYYYSNSSGTVQLLTYTTHDLLEEYKSKAEEFLNGFVEVK